MSWDDDSYTDEYGEHRAARMPITGWKIARRVAGFAGVVAAVLAVVVGTVVAVNVVGLAAKPDGFAAPAAHGAKVALPPVLTPTEQADPADRGHDSAEETGAPSGTGAGAGAGTEVTPTLLVDPEWTARIAAATGIPERALSAYALAHVSITEDEPDCGLDWTTIAAIGAIESGHGSYAGTVLDDNGNAQPPIIGRALDGNGVATIADTDDGVYDTDDGVYDGDATWDRAVGPMQFIPSTWAKWGSDANSDGVADPNQIDDAAQSAAAYLCASGPMTSPESWRAAIFSYNHDNSYVDKVATMANDYLARVG